MTQRQNAGRSSKSSKNQGKNNSFIGLATPLSSLFPPLSREREVLAAALISLSLWSDENIHSRALKMLFYGLTDWARKIYTWQMRPWLFFSFVFCTVVEWICRNNILTQRNIRSLWSIFCRKEVFWGREETVPSKNLCTPIFPWFCLNVWRTQEVRSRNTRQRAVFGWIRDSPFSL